MPRPLLGGSVRYRTDVASHFAHSAWSRLAELIMGDLHEVDEQACPSWPSIVAGSAIRRVRFATQQAPGLLACTFGSAHCAMDARTSAG